MKGRICYRCYQQILTEEHDCGIEKQKRIRLNQADGGKVYVPRESDVINSEPWDWAK